MRRLYRNRTYAKDVGRRGAAYVSSKFSSVVVAQMYSDRLKSIYNEHLERSNRRIGANKNISKHTTSNVLSNLNPAFSMSSTFRFCAVTSSKVERGKVSTPVITRDDSGKITCKIAIITTWAPRKCGIATYSSFLRQSLLDHACNNNSVIDIIGVKQGHEQYEDSSVKAWFRLGDFNEYVAAASYINSNNYNVISVQYEFGMLLGEFLTCLLRSVNKSVRIITTIHAVERFFAI